MSVAERLPMVAGVAELAPVESHHHVGAWRLPDTFRIRHKTNMGVRQLSKSLSQYLTRRVLRPGI